MKRWIIFAKCKKKPLSMKRWMIFAKCKKALINEKMDNIREMQKRP